ncbi:MAG: nickel-dependent hydrogenase large subunit [Deltaproteobacteria bacterium]|nr:nickel-dependent hydrogenase large subunit [Deltaproteobacteria bacterium]
MTTETRTIEVGYLARVEGEGALTIELDGERAVAVKLRIFEPPRFFEAFLRGRSALEAPDLTSRICGICPVAYQLSACGAIEDALGLSISEPIRALRRLLYCGEWIESHALHVFMLHAPDFLGYDDAFAMAKDHGDMVRRGLAVKKVGNEIVSAIGGRAIHPINVRVGGFYRAPARRELAPLVPAIEDALASAQVALGWAAGFTYPDVERDYELVALRDDRAYPFCDGRIVSSAGIAAPMCDFDTHFVERQVPHATALHAEVRGRGASLCGPLARFGLDADLLGDVARAAARSAGLAAPCRNPYRSILVRLVEIAQALDEARRLIAAYVPPDPPCVTAPIRPGVGHACTEAPRGMLYHRYEIDETGAIADADIVPPTSHNQRVIEEDLFAIAGTLAALPHDEATLLAERTVRNHDPCISCATHFLDLRIVRR